MFDIKIQHRRGTSHSNADALSRRPCEYDTPCRQFRGAKEQADLSAWKPADETRLCAVTTRAAGKRGEGRDDNRRDACLGNQSVTHSGRPGQATCDAEQQLTVTDAEPSGDENVAHTSRALTQDTAIAVDDVTLSFAWTKDNLAV